MERGVLEAEGGVCRRGRSSGKDGGRPRPSHHLPHRAGLRHDQVPKRGLPTSQLMDHIERRSLYVICAEGSQ